MVRETGAGQGQRPGLLQDGDHHGERRVHHPGVLPGGADRDQGLGRRVRRPRTPPGIVPHSSTLEPPGPKIIPMAPYFRATPGVVYGSRLRPEV
ncbi:hypothetical protein Plo01_20930 [Planobispora longispora]|uniref:Uncharacterized protein n=1 Tax=Planobispora longispora TaxID=28887 RepID=A0A8J3W3S0_9ACTN|nr:hypothetical protein Plo01_20930 [Planobispora longispora]